MREAKAEAADQARAGRFVLGDLLFVFKTFFGVNRRWQVFFMRLKIYLVCLPLFSGLTFSLLFKSLFF